MRTVAYDGIAAVTTDEVAEALMEFALTVARYSSYEAVTFPVVAAGQVEQLTLMLGPTIHLSAITMPTRDEVVVPGAAAAVRRMRERAAELSEPQPYIGLSAEELAER